jgi:hypothetical protein
MMRTGYILLAALATSACGGEALCTQDNLSLEDGETVEDGCYTKTCLASGDLSSKLNGSCSTDCTADDGTVYELGFSWPAGDGCNFCQCKADKVVECSMAPCAAN